MRREGVCRMVSGGPYFVNGIKALAFALVPHLAQDVGGIHFLDEKWRFAWKGELSNRRSVLAQSESR
jgi:hypothetical protein